MSDQHELEPQSHFQHVMVAHYLGGVILSSSFARIILHVNYKQAEWFS